MCCELFWVVCRARLDLCDDIDMIWVLLLFCLSELGFGIR